MSIVVSAHPLLDLRAFRTTLPGPLGELPSPGWLGELLRPGAPTPLQPADDQVRAAIRDMLRRGGYKPTGRGKPASEFLLKAATDVPGGLASINAAVDAGNAVSLASGIPISVVDLDLASGPLSVREGAAGESYVFNPSGQSIDLQGLLCLCDAAGPCANAVKDAMRTKTGPSTRVTLSLLWSSRALPGRVDAAMAWYRELLERSELGARCELVAGLS